MADNGVAYETLLDHLNDGVYFVDRRNIVTYWNRGAERITGHPRGELLGREYRPNLLAHSDGGGNPAFDGQCAFDQVMSDRSVIERELFIRHRDGHPVPILTRIGPIYNSLDEVIGALEVFSDNTSKIKALQRIEELEEMALLCPLTGVGNRRYTQMALQNASEELKRYNWNFGVLFVDIDFFKRINDEHGHEVGDEMLRMVACALRSSLRSFDFVGRWGGEEFVVILPNITDEILVRVAERCRETVEASRYQTGGREIGVTVSIGAIMAGAEETPAQCVDRADRLMYQSKAGGRNRATLDA